MFIEPTILSLLIAYLRKGRFKNLENVHIEGWYLFFIAAGIQGILSIINKFNLTKANEFISSYIIYIITITYILMIITVVMNIEKRAMKIFFIGIILNLIVILANNGKMPVSIDGIKGINIETTLPDREFDIKHIGVNQDTKLVYLADIILIPRPYPLPKILSIGDIFLMIGLFVFLQDEMVYNKYNKDPKYLKV